MITSLFDLKLKSPKFESPTPHQSSKKLDTDASWETFKSFPPPQKKKKTYLGGNFERSVFEEVFSLLLVLLYK